MQLPSISGNISNKHNAHTGAYGYDYSTITLTVASWVTPEQVRQAYAKLRSKVNARNTYRSKSRTNVEMFRFVMEKATPPKATASHPGHSRRFQILPGGRWWRNGTEASPSATKSGLTNLAA